MLRASVLVIGDEILGGFVRDENATWIATRLREHGVPLDRVSVVPDDLDAIGEAIHAELARPRPRLLLTSGGIGSTPDDLTYEAVAAALGRELEIAPEIAHKVDAAITWTQAQGHPVSDEFVDHMMRMARVPAGATLLRPSRSWAPGVRLDLDGGADGAAGGVTIVILPGVPSQLRAIVGDVIEPDLLHGRGQEEEVAEIAHGFPESVLNPCFARLGREHPSVRVGSYPGAPMLVRLRGPAADVEAARLVVQAELERLGAGTGAGLETAWAERLRPTRGAT